MFTKLVFLIYLPLAFQFEEINIERSKKLATFAASIVENECKNCKTIMIIHSGQEISCDIFFNTVHSTFSMYTVIVDGNGTEVSDYITQDFIYIPELTIIFINTDVITVESVIFSLELNSIWNIRGKFLVLADGEDIENFDNFLEETFISFWERQALKVLLSIWKSNKIESYTYDPFQNNYQILIRKQDRLKYWFNRLVTNMYGEPIKLYQFDIVLKESAVQKISPDGKISWVGPDGTYFNVLAQALNTTLMSHKMSEDFDASFVPKADPSIPFSKYIKQFIAMFDFDILFNRMQAFSDNPLDKIFLYERNEWQIIVPKAGTIPQYLYMMLLVTKYVWIAIFISLLSVIIIRRILGAEKPVPIWDNLSFLLGTSAPYRNQMKLREKIVYSTWIWSCVVIVTLFQATFMSTLVVPKYYPNLDTLNDLLDSDLMIYCPEYTSVQINRILNSSKFMDHLIIVPKNITVYGHEPYWIDNYKDDYGVVVTKEQLYRLRTTHPLLFETNHLMSESPMPNAISYNMPRNKLYYEEFLRIFNTIQEAGLHHYWRKYDYFLERNITKQKHESKEKSDTLTLFHLQSAFMLLIFGLTISLIMFCGEIAWYKVIKEN